MRASLLAVVVAERPLADLPFEDSQYLLTAVWRWCTAARFVSLAATLFLCSLLDPEGLRMASAHSSGLMHIHICSCRSIHPTAGMYPTSMHASIETFGWVSIESSSGLYRLGPSMVCLRGLQVASGILRMDRCLYLHTYLWCATNG